MLKYFLLFCIPFLVLAGENRRAAIALKSVPCFETPVEGTLPRNYIDKLDTCYVESLHVDSTEQPWFRVVNDQASGWVRAQNIRYVSDLNADFIAGRLQGDEDKKRRLVILRKHPEWPRRIQRAVRNGQICMDMTEEQVRASWGKPLHAEMAFILGLGDHRTWFYKDKTGKPVCVTLQNERVIGWSGKNNRVMRGEQ
ncbi:MAG: hypothetical protein GF401_10530 [Chitinivibrionales bacterium]|nr:hypothetical protein [Chitinivibrionales bacterium]